MKSPYKKPKYEEQIQNEVNLYFRREANDPRLTFISVTKVELNNDFSQAKIYWDTFNPTHRGDIKKALSGSVGKIRSHLAHVLSVRHVPALVFFYDGQFEAELAITKLLAEEAQQKQSL